MKQLNFKIFCLFLTLLCVNISFSQRTVSGSVTDESGVPLPGVNVVIKGTETGTSTDFDGNYSISVSDSDILIFSFVGFTDKELEVSNADSFDISLFMGSDELEEIVLTGYGTTKRSNLTNSVSKLNTESLVDRPIMTLGEAFSGQLAGVYAQQSSGLPGAEFNIKVRGTNSITSGSNPLYIVDGMPVESMRDINIGDVESIDVLKDASAGATIAGTPGRKLHCMNSRKRAETESTCR